MQLQLEAHKTRAPCAIERIIKCPSRRREIVLLYEGLDVAERAEEDDSVGIDFTGGAQAPLDLVATNHVAFATHREATTQSGLGDAECRVRLQGDVEGLVGFFQGLGVVGGLARRRREGR